MLSEALSKGLGTPPVCPSQGRVAPHTPKHRGKCALERASRQKALDQDYDLPFGVSTQDGVPPRSPPFALSPRGSQEPGPAAAARARCTVAATRLGCRSTGGPRHPHPGGIPPLCPEQDSSAAGLSHQDPHAWCSWLVVWAQSYQVLGTTCPPWLSSPWFNSSPCSSPARGAVVQSRLVRSQSWGVTTGRNRQDFPAWHGKPKALHQPKVSLG